MSAIEIHVDVNVPPSAFQKLAEAMRQHLDEAMNAYVSGVRLGAGYLAGIRTEPDNAIDVEYRDVTPTGAPMLPARTKRSES